jgi:DNA-binding transcriptional regulator/RsmH inhibitor MraZ
MYDWPLNNAPFVLLVLACMAVIIIGSIVTALTTVRRTEFSRLQNEVKQLSMMQNEVKRLSKKITALEADEERRFLTELNNPNSAVAHRMGVTQALLPEPLLQKK